MKKLTDRQREVLDFIESYIEVVKYSPVLREVADRFDITVRCAYDHVEALIRKGWLEKSPEKCRTIRLVKSTEPKYIVEPGYKVIGGRKIKVGIPGTNIVKVN